MNGRETSKDITKYFSLKIQTAYRTEIIKNTYVSAEDFVYQNMMEADHTHLGYKHCLSIIDRITTRGDHGTHISYVQDLLGYDLKTLGAIHKPFPMPATAPTAISIRPSGQRVGPSTGSSSSGTLNSPRVRKIVSACSSGICTAAHVSSFH